MSSAPLKRFSLSNRSRNTECTLATELLGFYEHLAIRGPAQAEVLDSYNIKAKIAEKFDGLLVGALIDEELGRHLSSLTDRVDLFLLHELLA